MNIQTRLINLSKALETSLENQEEINFKPLVAGNSLRLDDDKAEQDPNQEDNQVDYFAIISGIFQLAEAERILLYQIQ